jgi:hypothetical protein
VPVSGLGPDVRVISAYAPPVGAFNDDYVNGEPRSFLSVHHKSQMRLWSRPCSEQFYLSS